MRKQILCIIQKCRLTFFKYSVTKGRERLTGRKLESIQPNLEFLLHISNSPNPSYLLKTVYTSLKIELIQEIFL